METVRGVGKRWRVDGPGKGNSERKRYKRREGVLNLIDNTV